MIKEQKGNLMEAKESILAHQVNCKGRMGAGVAKQIRKRLLSEVQYQKYRRACHEYGADLLGICELVETESGKWIANLFAEDEPTGRGLDTNYEALEKALKSLKYQAKGHSISLPGYLGCGLAGGDWEIVYQMIYDIFEDYPGDVVIYYIESSVERMLAELNEVLVCQDGKTEVLLRSWHGFPKGTAKETVMEWFRKIFDQD